MKRLALFILFMAFVSAQSTGDCRAAQGKPGSKPEARDMRLVNP